MHEVATAQEFHVIFVLLLAPPVLITPGSLFPTMCLISSRADLAQVAMRHVECSSRRNRHPVQCVVLDVRDPHRFLTDVLRGDSNCVLSRRRLPQDPSRNVLFSGAHLLISDFTWSPLHCDPPSAV